MFAFKLFAFLKWALAAVGVLALVLGGVLAIPVKSPPPLASIHTGARAIGHEGRPELSRFQARDGTWLAYPPLSRQEWRERSAGHPRAWFLGLVG